MRRWSALPIGSVGSGFEAHLSAPEIGQILQSRATLEVDLEVHGREVGSRTPIQKRVSLFREIGAILRAVWRGSDVDHTGVLAACVLVAHRMANVGVPE